MLELITKVHQYPEKEPSEIAEQDFQQYWAIANEQWKLLEALIEEYLKVIEDSQGNQDKDPLKKELCHAIGKLADIYYPVQRFLFENSNYTPDQLRPYEVFLSHTGKQKFSYVDTIFNQFQPYPTKVFFDIKTLYAGDPAKEQMKYAALNCNVAIVVLSKDFLKKKWPLLELSLFAARLRKKTLLSQSPKNLIFSTEEKLDLEFSLLFDFYDQEEKAAWADRVLSIPDFLVADFPTGIVHWEPLDSVNAQRVVNITLQRLKIEHPAGSLL